VIGPRAAFIALVLAATTSARPGEAERIAQARKLYDEGRWEEAARAAQGSPDQPAELDYIAGMALVRLQRWPQARQAFSSGCRKAPHDKRFPIEIAGVAYEQKDFPAAKANLRSALRLDPQDAYAQNFLATIYLLEDNLEAALKHWNRVEQPRLAAVTFDPAPHLSSLLEDRALAFDTPAILERDALLNTEARLANLEAFTRSRVQLIPEANGGYHAVIRVQEIPGWSEGLLPGALGFLRGLPYATVYPEFYNLRGTGMNVVSLIRWDDQKRRFWADFSSPWRGNPARRLHLYLDARDENWNFSQTLLTLATPPAALELRKVAAGAELRSVVNGRWSWSVGLELSGRSFGHLGTLSSPEASRFFANGVSFKSWARVDHDLLRVPERRLTVHASGEAQLGREFAAGLGTFTTVRGGVKAEWLPRAKGDDYKTSFELRAGNTFGAAPFDEFFQLGVERDNDLWLRGHPGTIDGRKGSAPLGRRYLLLNWDMDKNVYRGAFFTLKLGPFLDAGAIADPSGLFGSQGWLWDPGVQCKLRVMGVTLVMSYGRDLRGGRNAFYAMALH
jgi:hypothetical protein